MITIFVICVVVIVLIVILIGKANEPEVPTHKPVVRDIEPGMRTFEVNIHNFIHEHAGFLPDQLKIDLLKATLRGETKYNVSEKEYREILSNKEEYNNAMQIRSKCYELNNLGEEQEKSGDIDLAIETYEENIKSCHIQAHHSYDRLMILYRKRKDYQNELRVIDAALEVFKGEYDQEKYKQRKEKALTLLMKEKTNVVCYDMEAPNRFRIFNDSIELIASTPKTSTFILRVGDIENFFVWAEEQTAKGIQIELGKDIAELQKEIYERINVNAIRIAEKEYTKWLSVDRTSEKKIDKATAKTFEALDELAKCIKTSSNDKQTLEQIEHFRTTIEQIYSEL